MSIIWEANKYPFLIPYENVKDKLNEQWIGVEALRQINLILDNAVFEPLPDVEDSAKVFYFMIRLQSALSVSDANNKFVRNLVEAFLKHLTEDSEKNLLAIAKIMGINADQSSFSIPIGNNTRKPYPFSIDNKYLAELEGDLIFVSTDKKLFYKDKVYLTKTGLAELIMAKVSRKVCEMLYNNNKAIEECVLDAKLKL